MTQRRVRGSNDFVELLETRQLLSAVGHLGHSKAPQNASLSGTYSGTLHIGGKAANGKPDRTISITISSDTADGQIAGGISVESLGTFAFDGTVTGRKALLIFHDASASAGEVIAQVAPDGSHLVGRLIDQTGGNRISGGLSAASGGTAVSTSGIPAVVGSTSSSSTFQQKNLIGSYSGHTHLSGPRVFMFSVSPENIALGITNESDPGEVRGTLSVINVNFNFDGIINGDELTFVLSGGGAGRGTATVVHGHAVLKGTFADTLAAGTIVGAFTLTNPTALSSSGGTGITGGAPTGSNLPGSIGGPTTITPTPITGTGTAPGGLPAAGTGTGTGGPLG